MRRQGTGIGSGTLSETSNVIAPKGTGLVRSWSNADAFVYAFFSINLVTLGLYTMSQAYAFHGGMIPALIVSGVLMLSEIVVYAGLIAVMPRSGGDYVWQSRIFGGGLGFVLAITGWCFILWLWTPVYADMLRQIVIVPLAAVLGFKDAALGIAVSPTAWFLVCVATCALVFLLITFGMESYARVQRICFWVGNAGLVAVIAILFASSRSLFEAGFDASASRLLGLKGAYATIEAAGLAAGAATPIRGGGIDRVLLLLPFLAFFNLWPNAGASLYGEVNGAGNFRKNFLGMASALGATTVLAIVLLLAIAKGIGWKFYMEANAAYWASRWGLAPGPAAMPIWPYPALLALFTVHSTILRAAVLAAMSAWFFGWAGTMYLSSTRFLVSASLDRILPGSMAALHPRTRAPLNALLFMIVPGLLVSALFVFDVWHFSSLTLVSTLVIAVTFLGTGLAAVVLPFAKKELYRSSPLARFRIGKLPLISLFGLVFCAFLGFLLYEWLVDPGDLYGVSYRNIASMVFMALLYAGAIAIYLGMRAYRRRAGIDIDRIHDEDPGE
jgi:APA family basic amino acid/polyamine antiporter